MNPESNQCKCTNEGYSPDCPQAFLQGDRVLHTISGETRLKPRVYTNEENGRTITQSSDESSDDELPKLIPAPTRQAEGIVTGYTENLYPKPLQSSQPMKTRFPESRFRNDHDMMQERRRTLRRFEALTIDGLSLTGMSIGGFAVDLSKAAQKASEVAPLPASKLPIIFVDEELNFYHHFFQGIEILLGQSTVNDIVSQEKYHEDSNISLFPMMLAMIQRGYEPSDNEITVFVKKVITSTFELPAQFGSTTAQDMLTVAANLWGFQYIESGMQCKEADLQMWLSACHSQYRIIWFNTFKSAGLPRFAMDGVQTRYAAPSKKVNNDGTVMIRDKGRHITEIERNPQEAARIFAAPSREGGRSKRSHRDRGHSSRFLF